MKRKVYDTAKREGILTNRNKNIDYAISEMKSYLDKYPLDYRSYVSYIGLLIDSKRLEDANEIFKLIEPGTDFHDKFKMHANSILIKRVEYLYIIEKIRYYAYNNETKKAYEIAMDNYEFLKNMGFEIDAMILFFEKRLGIETDRDNYSYLSRQINDYSLESFMWHIRKHMENNCNNDISESSVFYEEFPINEVVEDIRLLMPNKKSLYCYNSLSEKHTFKYDACGSVDGVITDYFQAVTILGTDELITMYPFRYGSQYDYIDLNYLREKTGKKNQKERVRNNSRIDKFYEKYGKPE